MTQTATPARKWVPSFYVDELPPPARSHPEDWITREEGRHILSAGRHAGYPMIPIAEGDIVRFRSLIEWGVFNITTYSNGGWSSDRPIPTEANGFVEPGEPESYAASMDEFVENWIDAYAVTEGEVGPVDVYTWSEDVYFQLIIGQDQALSFTPVAVDDCAKAPRLVRHKKRGSTYKVLGNGRIQSDHWRNCWGGLLGPKVDMAQVSVYQCLEDSSLWVRPSDEFEDGRFEDLLPLADDQLAAQEA